MAPAHRGPSRGRVPQAESVARDERRARSIEEPLDVRLRWADVYPLLEVRNPLHGTRYWVMLPEFPARTSALCTCEDFARRGLGTCKHIEAAHRWKVEHPRAPPLLPRDPRVPRTRGLWKEIDRRLAGAIDRSEGSVRRRGRRAGAVLYDRPTTGPG